jgi:hypothetical protein
MLLAATAISSAATVQILANVSGCDQCGTGPTTVQPGTTITFTGTGSGLGSGNGADTMVQLTLGAGTYTITDAATTGTYSGWQYAGNSPWNWDFGIANDTTGKALLEDYVGGSSALTLATFASQSAINSGTVKIYDGTNLLPATTTALFSDTLTLGSATTLDFYVLDQHVSDNSGGIALNITQVETGVPEPASFLLVATVLAAGCWRLRRRA